MQGEPIPVEDDPSIYLPEQLFGIRGSMTHHALDKFQGSCLYRGPSGDGAGPSIH